MALPKVQNNDLVEIVFKNHDQIKTNHGDLYLSKNINYSSRINWDDISNIFVGGNARICESDKASITIDFNLAYAPFCAYSEQYSCALPPQENWTAVSVEAGERNPS